MQHIPADPQSSTINIDLTSENGFQQASLDPLQLASKSAAVFESAMTTIRQVAERVVQTLRDIELTERPSAVEVEFGLRLDAEAGAVIARVATQAGFTVKLTWKKSEDNSPSK